MTFVITLNVFCRFDKRIEGINEKLFSLNSVMMTSVITNFFLIIYG